MQRRCSCGRAIIRRRGARGRPPALCATCRTNHQRELDRRRRAREQVPLCCEACGARFARRAYRGGAPKRFCSEACRVWTYRHPGEPRPISRVCTHCQAPIVGRMVTAKYCTTACLRAVTLERLAAKAIYPRPAKCEWCGEGFEQRRGGHVYCSKPCARRSYYARHPDPGKWAGRTRRPDLPPDWSHRRRRVLERHPICRVCGDALSTEVDHIEPGSDHRYKNLQGICSSCHNEKTQLEAAASRRARRT